MENKNELNLTVREDIGKIVTSIRFAYDKGRYNTKPVCKVALYNGDEVTIDDRDNICSIISTQKKLGFDNCVKSVKLVEEVQKEITDEVKEPKYICVLVEINDGFEDRQFRLFPSSTDKARLNMYYNAFKNKEKNVKA